MKTFITLLLLSFLSNGPYKTATFDYYKVENSNELVVVFPPTGGGNFINQSISEFLAKNGFNVLNVTFHSKIFRQNQWEKIHDIAALDAELDYMKNSFENVVADSQKAIDMVFKKDMKVMAVGVSLGGIFATMLDANDKRVDGGVFMLSGADLAEIITQSKETGIIKIRKEVMKNLGLSQKQLYQEIKNRTQEIEPLNYLQRLNPKKILLINAMFDQVIPSQSKKLMRKALPGVTILNLPTGHYTAALFLNAAERATLNHLNKIKSLEKDYYQSKSVGDHWEAGVAKEDITPKGTVYIGGFARHKKSWSTHDPLSARCLVLSNGVDDVTIISLDLIGLYKNDVHQIRNLIKKENLIVSVTHTHSGPDTQGIWSRNGRDEDYMKFLFDKINTCVSKANSTKLPIEISFRSYKFENMSRFRSDKNAVDKNATVALGAYKNNEPAFVILNFAVHPNLINGRKISADFLAGFYDKLENKMNFPIAIFLNGAQGNVRPTKDKYPFKYGTDEAFPAAFHYGQDLANMIFQQQEKEPVIDRSHLIEAKRQNFNVKLENKRFKFADFFGLTPPLVDNGYVELEVNYIKIGALGIITIPGEAFPNIGLATRAEMKDEFKIICGLCNGAYGYIMLKEDYPKYDYHRSMSLGDYGETFLKNLKKIINPPT